MPTSAPSLPSLSSIKQQIMNKYIPVSQFAKVSSKLLLVCNGQMPGSTQFLLTYAYPGFTELQFAACLANNKRKVSDVAGFVTTMGQGNYTAYHKKPPVYWQTTLYEEIVWRTCWALVMLP